MFRGRRRGERFGDGIREDGLAVGEGKGDGVGELGV